MRPFRERHGSGEKGTRDRTVKHGCVFFFYDVHFEGMFDNTENFCETTRIHHVFWQITYMLQH